MSACDRCAAPQNPDASFCTKCGADLRTRRVSGRSITARVFLFVPKVLLAIGSGLVQILLSMADAADRRAQRAAERGESAGVVLTWLQKNMLGSSLGVRLANPSKWPRKLWRPLLQELNLSADDWQKQHDEISRAINKLLLVLIGFCFFCGLALGAPDISLLSSDAKVKLPFANSDISFVNFLVIAP